MRLNRLNQLGAIAVALLFVPWAGASAQSSSSYDSTSTNASSSRNDYDWLGPYVKLGLSIGFPDEDGLPKVDAGAGFDLAAGWRLAPWLAGEIDMNFIAGADVAGTSKDLSVFAFTFNVKTYPLGAFEVDGIPDSIQPYLLFGMGGGQTDLGSFDESSFMVRFGGGLDWWINENVGAYFDAGYLVIDESKTGLDGEGLLVFGGMYRF